MDFISHSHSSVRTSQSGGLVWFGGIITTGVHWGGQAPQIPPTGVGKQLSAVASAVAVKQQQQLLLSLSWAV